MHLRTVAWLLLLSLNVAFGEQKQDKRATPTFSSTCGFDFNSAAPAEVM